MSGIPIRGQAKGSATAAFEKAVARGAQRPDFTRDYFVALFEDAAARGIDADVLVAQWSLETGDGTSDYWVRDGNPAGLAAFDDGSNWGLTFSPQKAARAHVVHMCAYLGLTDVPPDWIATDARWQAVAEAGYVGTVTATADLGNGRWATDPDYASKVRSRYLAYWGEPDEISQEGTAPMTISFGRVPDPGYIDLQHTTAGKPEGVGWDNLGKREPKFIALHRMLGTLAGTANWFARNDVGALTDYGLGVADVDGAGLAGVIHKYNDPLGWRSGWASGRVSAPYGDGKAIVDRYGINAVNRDGVSIEISGYQDTPVDEVAWGELVALCAYWIDHMQIPYTALPKNPHTGINALIWHQEFCIGTGKECPFRWVMQNTDRLYEDVKAYLQPYQEGTQGETQPQSAESAEVPPPQYATPAPIAELAALGNLDPDTATAVAEVDGQTFYYVNDQVEARRDTPRLRYAAADAERVGPDIRAGEAFDVTWLVRAADGSEYYITDYWTRVRVADTERLQDAAAD
jgi:hypothetical protein